MADLSARGRGLRRFALVVALVGCGGASELEKVVVEGQVTVDGQPVQNGEIRFFPINGTPGAVSGGPIRDGRYKAEAKGGVPVGEQRVEIEAYRRAGGRMSEDVMNEGGAAVQYLPPKFNAQSELTVVVDADHAVHDFELSTSGP
jgi:hypothetical protein